MFYYVIVTSYVDRFSWFWYQWKEETLPFSMVPNNYTLGVSISSSQGVITTPRKTCYKKAQEDEGKEKQETKNKNKQTKKQKQKQKQKP